MAPRALIVWGGWEPHQPQAIAEIFAAVLRRHRFDVEVSTSLDAFLAPDLDQLSLIVPVWTMGEISEAQLEGLMQAVEGGVGIGGCHGGMCDAFRDAEGYQFMTGGQFVEHPGGDGVEYPVQIRTTEHYVTRGAEDFTMCSEQYYMHVDPSNDVLATTPFPLADGPHVPNGSFDMPVVWTRRHGAGRVFYCSIGHRPEDLSQPPVLRLCTRGLLWAAGMENEEPDAA